jgi:endonuclease YncB( thermonuclease family)
MMTRKETVTKIIDGDTIETSVRKKPIRIEGIDTPEKGQPGYAESKKALSELLKDEKVTVTPVGTDAYGRTVAKVKKGNRLVSTLMKKYEKK